MSTLPSQSVEIPEGVGAVSVELALDLICPWSFVMKRRLERVAGSLASALPLRVTWRSLEINPKMPRSGIPRCTYERARCGSLSEARRTRAALQDAGVPLGIAFAFDAIRWAPNTRDAHRLVHFAAERGRGAEALDALFSAYFEGGEDIGSRQTLTETAVRLGLDAEAAAAYLAERGGDEHLSAEARRLGALGIRSTPTLVLNGRAVAWGELDVSGLEAKIRHAQRSGTQPLTPQDLVR